jgi:hypothetical protein
VRVDPHRYEVDWCLRPNPDEEIEHSERDQRRPEELHAAFVDEPPDHEGHHDLNVDRDDAGRLADEQSRNRHREDREHEPDQHQHEAHEQDAGSAADGLGRDVRDRASLFAHARDQRAKVMGGAHEDGPKNDPGECGSPTPVRSDAGTNDRSRSGDRREVVSEQHCALCGHEVDPVLELVRRRNDVLLVLEDTLAEKSRVESIRDQERTQD